MAPTVPAKHEIERSFLGTLVRVLEVPLIPTHLSRAARSIISRCIIRIYKARPQGNTPTLFGGLIVIGAPAAGMSRAFRAFCKLGRLAGDADDSKV